ncbi:UDP-glucose:protein N-beta-glucosyltransferase [Phycisphaerales bacterium]|nr:UDP-glucose:protein N-beta-glucosyltransferase [Phycisphaerales bacterium]
MHGCGRCSLSRSGAAIQNAIALFESGRHEQAKQTLRLLLQRSPQDPQANKYLAMFHGGLHEDEQALVFITRAAMAAPNDQEIQFILGNVAMILKKYKEGVRAYSAVIRLNPDSINAYDGLGKCLLSLGDYPAAMEAYEKAIARNPDNEDIYYRMGVALAVVGRVEEALAVARRGLERLPNSLALLEFVTYNQNFKHGVDPIAHRQDHERLGRLVAAAASRPVRPFGNTPDPERPLRVAFLSGDFVLHACAFFLEGPLRALDRSRIVPFLYSAREQLDPYSERFKSLGEWRNVFGLKNEQIDELARADGIDVLVECAGWTDRAIMFACTPRVAPVQITYLGYPNTTGLPSIDYRIVDWKTDPVGAESQCTEQLVRLPRTFLCYRPYEKAMGPFDERPASAVSGTGVTFGSFNRVTKISDAALRAWGEILRRTPGSRLMVKIQIASGEVTTNFSRKIESLGVPRERVVGAEFVEKTGDHFPMYRKMDIALDSFPYNGTTTTCEAMWMGVPVVALAGQTHRARVGVSLLESVGASELVAANEEEYVNLAVGLAGDPGRLAGYHRSLRSRMSASPLMDAPGFARDFEAAVRGAWRAWCESPLGRAGARTS